jgi:signal peptidase I
MRFLLRPWRSLTRSPLRRAFSLIGAALGVVLWLALAPAALGGSSTYVTTYGISMEPTLHRGDLAVVRAQPSYHVGDIVAYRSETLHTVVLHRIIGRDGERFVFKGDNNTWVDTDHPTESALIGKMEMRLPGVGTQVQKVASPGGMGAVAAVAALPMGLKRSRKRKNAERPERASRASRPARPARTQPVWRHLEPRLLVVTAVAVGLLALAFTKPPTTHTTSDMPFDDRGEFTYSGAAPGGSAVYQSESVSSGQPIFFSLVHRVELGFTYSVSSVVPLIAQGDLALTGELSDIDGWTYPVDVASPVHFESSSATASGALDLDGLRATIADMEAATGLKRDSYTLMVKASVSREVHRGDAIVSGPFVAPLEFKVDATSMHLATPGGNALTPSQGGLLSLPRQAENHFDLLGQSFSIAMVRAVALALILIVAALWVDMLVRASRADETSLIERRYRNYLLPVLAEPASEMAIDVDSITALARIADHSGAPMLQGRPGVYHVVDGPRVYRYRVVAIDVPSSEPVAVAATVMPPAVRRERPLRAHPRVES